MKANVLEKIYLSKDSIESIPNDDPLLQILSIKEDGDIEYIRKDAFIEKACEWLKDNIYHRVYECGDRLGFPTANFIGDFKKYMEGDKV